MSKSLKHVVKKLELPYEDDALTHERLYLANHDLLPVPVSDRIWGHWSYLLYWFAEGGSVTTMTIVGTPVKSGMAWWEAWLVVMLSRLFVAIVMMCTGRPGSVYHVPCAVVARASFGIWGSYFSLIMRNCLGIIWTGVQFVSTGNVIYVTLHAIIPQMESIPNPFGPDQTETGGRLVGFVIGWIIVFSCCFVPLHKFKPLIPVKSAATVFFLGAWFIWIIVKGHGVGSTITAPTKTPVGMTHGWFFIKTLFTQAAVQFTFGASNADITRYAKTPKSALWTQVAGFPIGTGVTAFFGTFIVSASASIYGTVIWDPASILDGFLDNYTAGNRAGVFFIGLGLSFAQVATIILADIIACGNDTACLLPRYVNCRRGAQIAMTLAFAICPWNMLKSNSAFASYLSSYAAFLGGLIGIMGTDYFIIRRGFYDLHQLFSGKKDGLYYYTGGFNTRAFAAYFITMAPYIPGFCAVCGLSGIPLPLTNFFYTASLTATLASGAIYYALCYIFPLPGGMSNKWLEIEPKEDFVTVIEDTYSDSAEGVETVPTVVQETKMQEV